MKEMRIKKCTFRVADIKQKCTKNNDDAAADYDFIH